MEKAVVYSLGKYKQLHSSSPSHSEYFNESTDVRLELGTIPQYFDTVSFYIVKLLV